MARIRTIKPEFFTSEDIVSLSPLARLLYIALWCEADKEGRMVWKPRTLKMRYFPGDDCNIEGMCNELVSSGLVVLYGEGFAHIPGFAKHQHVNPRESVSTLPVPPTHVERRPSHIPTDIREVVMSRDGGKCVRCGSDDHPQLDHILPQSIGGPHIVENLRVLCRSCNAGRPVSGKGLDEDLAKDGLTVESLRVKFGIDASILDLHAQGGREGKGKEGKGREGENISTYGACPPQAADDLIGRIEKPKSTIPPCPYQAIADAYHEALPQLPALAVLNDARKRHMQARWREVCAADGITDADAGVKVFRDFFSHVARSPFLMGHGPPDQNKRVWRADFDWLLLPTNFVKVVEGRYHGKRAA